MLGVFRWIQQCGQQATAPWMPLIYDVSIVGIVQGVYVYIVLYSSKMAWLLVYSAILLQQFESCNC